MKSHGLWCSTCLKYLFLEHLLCARPNAKLLGIQGEPDRHDLCPQGAYGQVGQTDIKQIMTQVSAVCLYLCQVNEEALGRATHAGTRESCVNGSRSNSSQCFLLFSLQYI